MLSLFKETVIKTSLKLPIHIFDILMKIMNSLLEKTHIQTHMSFTCDLSLLDYLYGQLKMRLSYSVIERVMNTVLR